MTSIASYSDTIDHGWHPTPLNQPVDEKHSVATCQTVLHLIKDGFVSVMLRPFTTTPDWTMHTWAKKVIVLGFRFLAAQIKNTHPLWRNNIDVWTAPDAVLQNKKIPIVPGGVRKKCHIGQPICTMQSSINIQAHINQDTMMVYGAYIKCCAFGGQYYHISANTSIDGVLEPQNEQPAIIEDTIFFGTECHVAKRIHVEKNRMLSSGALLTGSTKTIGRTTNSHYIGHMPAHSIHYVKRPAHSVGVPGPCSTDQHELGIKWSIITKQKNKDSAKKINSQLGQ